jgi:hypothetical protein
MNYIKHVILCSIIVVINRSSVASTFPDQGQICNKYTSHELVVMFWSVAQTAVADICVLRIAFWKSIA